jgi:hypothetical protein
LIATAGVGAAFVINAASFIGLIWVVARWKRPRRKRTTPPERVIGATVEAVRYVRYSPEIRGLILRSGVVMFFASALLALLPTVAHRVNGVQLHLDCCSDALVLALCWGLFSCNRRDRDGPRKLSPQVAW